MSSPEANLSARMARWIKDIDHFLNHEELDAGAEFLPDEEDPRNERVALLKEWEDLNA